MSNSVEYIIRLRDLATNTLNKITLANEKTDKSFKNTQQSASAFDGLLGKVSVAALAYGAFSLGKSILSMGNDMQQATVAMEVMTGSADVARKHITDLKNFAAVTPFETADLIDASKVMQQFGISVNSVLPLQQALGDASGGNAERFKQMTLAFSQMSSAGKLQGQDLLQMINAGFNPLMEISKRTGVSMADLRKQMENGAISSAMIAESFGYATSEGGQFFNMMEKQSQTIAGRWSTFTDKIKNAGLKIFESSEGGLSKLLDVANDVLSWFETNWGLIAEMFKPLWDAIQPIIEAFQEVFMWMGLTGDTGSTLGKVFNMIGTIINIVSPILKVLGFIAGEVIKVIGAMVIIIFEAIKAVTDFFGLTSKTKFKKPEITKAAEVTGLNEYLKTDMGKAEFNTNGTKPKSETEKKIKEKNSANARTANSSIKNITINIGSLVDGLTVQVNETKEMAPRIKEEITKYLLSAVNDVNIIGA